MHELFIKKELIIRKLFGKPNEISHLLKLLSFSNRLRKDLQVYQGGLQHLPEDTIFGFKSGWFEVLDEEKVSNLGLYSNRRCWHAGLGHIRDVMFSSNKKNKPYFFLNEEIRFLTWNTMVIRISFLEPVTCLFWAPPRYLLWLESAAARISQRTIT